MEACPELGRSDAEGRQGNSLETIRQMVVSGFGITVMPYSALTSQVPTQTTDWDQAGATRTWPTDRSRLASRLHSPTSCRSSTGSRQGLKDPRPQHGGRITTFNRRFVLLVAPECIC
ncbi:type 2 periplasmic-binding domain-containing protein [Candidatus Nitrospira nitrosa]|uniref:hypothetical protein n=1 Tax=Candidatus Nitrospira nitrosa TaxID=1742972 RepID=UPI00316AD032